MKYPAVMTIAGFDPSGGAGIQADIKTISALGCYATSVLTALPVQNTCGVRSIHAIPVEVVAEQMRAVMDDIVPDAVKIGMVHSVELVDVIVETLGEYPSAPLVFDPVMVATSGHRLIEDETIAAIVERLFPMADVITPNLDEGAVLAGMEIETVEDMREAGERILELGARAVLLKGGHLKSEELTSLFFDGRGGVHEYRSRRVDTCNTHGSGCTLSSAIASYVARGEELEVAVRRAQEWVTGALESGAEAKTGKGNGPLNHLWAPEAMIKKSI